MLGHSGPSTLAHVPLARHARLPMGRAVTIAAICALTIAAMAAVSPGATAVAFFRLAEAVIRVATTVGDAGMALAIDGMHRRPVLVAAVAGLPLVPVLAVVGIVLRWLWPAVPEDRPTEADAGLSVSAPSHGRTANLEIERLAAAGPAEGDDTGTRTMVIQRDVVQIGREDDNDICLADDSVHRYHAVIERCAESGFVVTDLSGPDGNGVRVNGERFLKSSLADGDVVELGRARIKFSSSAREGRGLANGSAPTSAPSSAATSP